MATRTLKIGLSDSDKANMKAQVQSATFDAVADAYSSSATYSKGDVVTYEGGLYQAKQDISTAEAWTSAHWDAITLQDEVDDAIDAYEDAIDAVDSKITRGAGERDATLSSGYADLADNLDSKLGITDRTPFLSRTTAGGEEVANTSKVHRIIGGSLPIVQLVQNGNFDNADNWSYYDYVCTLSVSNNVMTVAGGENGLSLRQNLSQAVPSEHKILLRFEAKSADVNAITLKLMNGSTTVMTKSYSIGSSFTRVEDIISLSGAINRFQFVNGGSNKTVYFRKVNIIELAQTFGTTVTNRLAALETATAGAGIAKAKQILVKDYYPYNVTDFTHVKTSGKVNTKFNQFDLNAFFTKLGITNKSSVYASQINAKKLWNNDCNYAGRVEVYKNGVVNNGTGNLYVRFYYSDGTNSTDYVNGNLSRNGSVISTNGKIVTSVRFTYDTGDTFNFTNAKICISLYWDGERTGEYEDYVEYQYPCSNVELKGFISLDANDNWVYDGDEYLPSGVVKRKRYSYTFTGNESGGLQNNCVYIYLGASGTYKPNNTLQLVGWAQSDYDTVVHGSGEYIMAVINGNTGAIGFQASSITTLAQLQAALAGKTIYFSQHDVTPETEDADPYNEQQSCDNWGAEKWIDNRDVPLPVSAEIEYLPDLKAKTESQPSNPDEDGDYVMHRENGENSYTPLNTYLSDNGYEKQTDLSSEITDSNSLSWDIKKAYKTGNIVSLTIRASSPNSIASNLTIFNLGSSLRPSSVVYAYARVSGQASQIFIDPDGRVFSSDAVSAEGYVVFTISYAVA